MVQSIAAQNEVVEDEIPENVEPVTKPGDLWKLGRHRLLCTDSKKPDEVLRIMDEVMPTLVATDPAYCDVIVKRWENLTGETAERLEG